MKKTILNSYSAPSVDFYNVAIERGFNLSNGEGDLTLPGMGSTNDSLDFE